MALIWISKAKHALVHESCFAFHLNPGTATDTGIVKEQFECCEKKIDDEIDEQVMDDKSGTKHTVSLSKTKLWEEKYEKQVG